MRVLNIKAEQKQKGDGEGESGRGMTSREVEDGLRRGKGDEHRRGREGGLPVLLLDERLLDK